MTNEELAAIEQRLQALTLDPWEWYENAESAEFISHAPADIKALIAEVRMLCSLVDAHRG